jgi:hypothetical protein
MSADKIEPRLQNVVENERLRASRLGADPEEIDQRAFDVIISHAETAEATEDPSEEDRPAALEQLHTQILQSQASILAKLDEIGAPAERTVHRLANAVSTRLTLPQMTALSELDEVAIIRSDAPEMVTCINESVHVMDTGADKTHPALAGKIVAEANTTTEPLTVVGNHATHTAGTIVSQDPVYRGIAWGADLVNIKVLTAFGFGTPSWVINGLAEAVLLRARVVSMSLGWSEVFMGWVCNDADCVLCVAADNAVRLGVAVVVAAGNEGTAGARPPFAIRHPGAARRVLTVGATDKVKVLAPFSSIGPGSGRLSPLSPLRITKPEVAAPGVNVTSSVLGGGFGMMSGTSMATPHVAALAAILISKRHSLRPMEVKKLIEDSCQPLPLVPDDTGYGLISAYGSALRVV